MSRFQHSLSGVFYTSIASINTPDYVEIHLYRRPTGRPSFTARLVGCSLRASWQVLQTRKLTVTAQRSLLAHTCGHVSCRSLFWR